MNEKPSRETFLKSIRPDATQVGTWKYLWKNHRLTLFMLFMSFLRERPLFTVFLTLFCISPSLIGFIMVFLALLVSQSWNELIGQLDVIANQLKIIKGALIPIARKCDDLKIEEYKVSQYLPPFAYNDISYFLVESFQKIIPFINKDKLFTLDDQLSVIVLDTENAILQNVSSYPAPLRQSFIIFDHSPSECGVFQRFAILHEVGHVVLGLAKNTYFGKHGFKTMLFSLIIGLICFHIDKIAWIFIFLFYILGYRERFYLSYTADVRDEIACDIFALSYLEAEDINRLSRISDLSRRLSDSKLTRKHNKQRIVALETALQNVDDWIDDPVEKLETNKSLDYKPNVFRLLIMAGLLAGIAPFILLRSGVLITLFSAFIILLVLFIYTHALSMSRTKGLKEFILLYKPELPQN